MDHSPENNTAILHILYARPADAPKGNAGWEPMAMSGINVTGAQAIGLCSHNFDADGLLELSTAGKLLVGYTNASPMLHFHAFFNGAAAAQTMQYIKKYGAGSGMNYRILKAEVTDPDLIHQISNAIVWRDREAKRMTDGTYKPAPWINERWYKDSISSDVHFPHASDKNPGKVAFTRNENDGRGGKYFILSPGAYLRRFFNLTPNVVSKWCEQFAAENGAAFVLKFAMTPDEIEHVYENGPDSCMSGNGDWETAKNPVRVYGAGDLAAAYGEDEDGRIVARSMVWPERHIYTRGYGDDCRELHAALTDQGYKNGSLVGAKLFRLPIDGRKNCFVCPYLDTGHYVVDRVTHLEICDGGTKGAIVARNTDGTTGAMSYCSYCEEPAQEEDLTNVLGGGRMCEPCVEREAFFCDVAGRFHAIEDYEEVDLYNGGTAELQNALNYRYFCDATDDLYYPHSMFAFSIGDPDDGQKVSTKNAAHYEKSEIDGLYRRRGAPIAAEPATLDDDADGDTIDKLLLEIVANIAA